MSFTQALTVLFLYALPWATAYPDGPPVDQPEVCSTMFPIGHGADAQATAPPYEFQLSSSCYSQVADIQGRLIVKNAENSSGLYFEGFFIQMRDYFGTDAASFGKFTPLFDTKTHTQTLDCFADDENALGQAKAEKFVARSFAWTSANETEFTLQLVATVVKEKDEFWTDIVSQRIDFSPTCLPSPTQFQQLTCEYTSCSGADHVKTLFTSPLSLATMLVLTKLHGQPL